MFEAKIIGEWVRPHPDGNPNLDPIRTPLYERPDDSAIPKTITVNSINEDGEVVTKEVAFHDSILGASVNCDGCGEPFGQQIKIKRDMWVSPTQVTYLTDKGKLRFCQDVFACSRRAADRLPMARDQQIQKALEDFSEKTGVNVEGSSVCQHCKRTFLDDRPSKGTPKKYCGQECRTDAANARRPSVKRPRKPTGRKPGRPRKLLPASV